MRMPSTSAASRPSVERTADCPDVLLPMPAWLAVFASADGKDPFSAKSLTRLWKQCRRRTDSDDEAADVFQQACLALWERSRKETVRNSRALLRRIASCETAKLVREKKAARGRFPDGSPELDALAQSKDFLGEWIEVEHIVWAISQMERRRRIVLKYWLRGMRPAQIAERLRARRRTVSWYLEQAKAELGHFLLTCGIGRRMA